jgi:uncharacterized protein (TIGR02246 family)
MSIEMLLKAYETALNTNDIEVILNLYSQSPVFMPQHAPALIGREAVRAGYRQVFETIQLKVTFTIHEVEVLGDTAWARTSSAGRTRILAAGWSSSARTASGRSTATCSRPPNRARECATREGEADAFAANPYRLLGPDCGGLAAVGRAGAGPG